MIELTDECFAFVQGYSGDDITNVCETGALWYSSNRALHLLCVELTTLWQYYLSPTAKRMPVKRVYTPGLLMELSRQDQEAGDELRDLLEKKRLIVTKVCYPLQSLRLLAQLDFVD